MHEIPLALLDEEPSMLLGLVRAAGGPLVDADDVVPVRESFADVVPATYAADRVYLARRGERPVAAFVVELQRQADSGKHFSWPMYLASAHARLGVRTSLVVVTLDRAVARWARRPIPTFQDGCLAPHVIGPDEIPRDLEGASLELMVLATMAHGEGAVGGAIAVRALSELRIAVGEERLDGARMRLYTDLVLASIDDVARKFVEGLMIDIKNWEPQSDFAKHWKREGRTEAAHAVCTALGIAWTPAREARVSGASAAELETLLAAVVRDRRWPDE
jgi:hypothetical protein